MKLRRLRQVFSSDADEVTKHHYRRAASVRRPWLPQFSCCELPLQDLPQFFDTAGVAVAAAAGGTDGAAAAGNPRVFSYAELYVGSNGFSERELLGSGGYGRVYRTVLPSDGSLAAVKRVASSGDHSEKTFAAELAAVAQLRHRNLVRLRGWCNHDSQLLLVYDYMPNGSLDRLLFSPPRTAAPPLVWPRRRRVLQDLAAALFYLHDQLDTQIIHRDVKSSNVLLDSAFRARLGDFGLARWREHDNDADGAGTAPGPSAIGNKQFRLTETSRTSGTIGYLPPEGFQSQPPQAVTAKSDVFSFGVVVLEVAAGRRAVDLSVSDEEIILLDWVRRLADDGRCLAASDRRLPEGSFSPAEMERLIHLGLLCTLHDPTSRPTMKWVMEMLSGNYSGDLPVLPSFRAHPQYISLSSSSAASTSDGASGHFTNCNSGGAAGGQHQPASLTMDMPREIPFREIVEVTKNFSRAQVAAEMDFGKAYHGYLDHRFHVLVKRLSMKTCPVLRRRFSDELHNLGRLRHRHLVQLRGWCDEQGEMLVVYDYPSGGLLSRHLFLGGGTTTTLPWRRRCSILRSLASAVLYLHEEWEEQVIHRNITSSAVFLDPDKNPRLGCFSLAEFLTRDHHGGGATTATSSSARGIFGYMAPEYIDGGEVTPMADVYSFGVVIMEVATGRRAVDFSCPDVLLVKKMRKFMEKKKPLEQMVDRKLGEDYEPGQLWQLLQLGLACTHSDPQRRPTMRQVASILGGNDKLLRAVGWKKEGRELWWQRNAAALSLVRRLQALGIH
ncbi:unnamed protein product [Spirodela intermedia]|uniref:Protein kinase domain-containing protein n=1 Tax=Spirodela intermedia TaxID=51605 RepID=A0A7I8KFV9_SPIIN|nr:unnamed protein product [Spirodela intermedia]